MMPIMRKSGYSAFILVWLNFSAPVYAEIITIEGVVKSVDAKKRTITVESGAKEQTLDVSSKTKISVTGKDAALDSLKSGQKVKLSYHDDLEVALKIEVAPSNSDEIVLFDGKTLKGWKMLDFDSVQGWEARNGELVALPLQDVPLLLTEEKFDDFEFECEFWLDAKANSGIYLRGRYEVQLIDDGSFPKAGPKSRCGSIVGQLAPIKAMYRGPREWNTLVVRLENKTVTIVMNETTIIEKRYINEVTGEAVDDLEKQPGPIALQNRGGLARFRNLKIRSLNQ